MRGLLRIGALALLLAGCTPGIGQRPAATETLATAVAVVEGVNPATREVRLRDTADGRTFSVIAGAEVRNFDQLAPGDQVQLDFYEATAVALTDPADTGETVDALLTGRTPEGAKPGGVAIATTSLVVEVVSYDPANGLATFRTADGVVRRATVDPALRSFAAARRPGDRVTVTLVDAVAITISETGN